MPNFLKSLSCGPVCMRMCVCVTYPHIIDTIPYLCARVLPRTLMDPLLSKHGVDYTKLMQCTESKQMLAILI